MTDQEAIAGADNAFLCGCVTGMATTAVAALIFAMLIWGNVC